MTVIRPIPVAPAALQTSAGQTGSAAQTPGTTVPQAAPTLASVLSEQKAMLLAVLQQALGEAAPRQNGLAPLMADAEVMLASHGKALPQAVKAALQDVLATRLNGQGALDSAKLQAAVKQSGAFLESGLATGQPVQGDLKAALLGLRQALQNWLGGQGTEAVRNAGVPSSSTAPAQAQPQLTQTAPPSLQTAPSGSPAPSGAPLAQLAPAMPSTPLRDAALRLLAETDAMIERPVAQPLTTTNTPLKSNLEAMLARHGSAMPQNVREAIQTVLGQRPAVAGDNTKPQVALPASAMPLPDMAPAGDLKSALIALRQSLENWLGPKPSSASLQPNTASPLPAHTPPPPPRSGATVPQPPALPAALDMMPVREAGMRLLAETDAALARHTMLQVASLPDDPAAPRSADNAQRLVLDIPLVTPHGTAIVQLRIEREEKRDAKGKKASVWQAMFSIDMEPIGPVHARVAMVGDTANVSLFAERGDSATALRENIALLQAGLAEAAVEPGDILCARGAPATPAAAPGLFVDRAT